MDTPVIIFLIFTVVFIITSITIAVVAWCYDRNIIYTTFPKNFLLNKNDKHIGIYFLPETVLEILSTAKVGLAFDESGKLMHAKLAKQDFSLSTFIQADTSVIHSLKYNENPFSNEKITLSSNENGLLESLDVISDNQTPKIVASLLNTSPELGDGHKARIIPDEVKADYRWELKEFSKTFKVNAWESTKNPITVNWDIMVPLGNHTKGANPFNIINGDFVISSIRCDTLTQPLNQRIQETNSEKSEEKKRSNIADKDLDKKGKQVSISKNDISGVLFRAKTPVIIDIKGFSEKNSTSIIGLSFFNREFSYSIPIRSTPFVERKQKLIIKNGELLSHSIENPSLMVGLVSIPIEIFKSIMSIPAQIISLRIDTTARKKELKEVKNALSREIIKSKKYEKMLRKMNTSVRNSTLEDIKVQNNDIESRKKILKLENLLAQSKIDSSMEMLRLDRQILDLKTSRSKHPSPNE